MRFRKFYRSFNQFGPVSLRLILLRNGNIDLNIIIGSSLKGEHADQYIAFFFNDPEVNRQMLDPLIGYGKLESRFRIFYTVKDIIGKFLMALFP